MRRTQRLIPLRQTGLSVWMGDRMLGHDRAYSVKNVLCHDGKYRTAYIQGEPDTYFSQPARMHYAGAWHKGFISVHTEDDLDSSPVLCMMFVEYEEKSL